MSKHGMKAKITILNSSSSTDKEDTNSLSFMASRSVNDPPIAPSQGHKVIL